VSEPSTETGAQTEIVGMTGIVKSFPGVHALQNVDFSLARGEIHALVGEIGRAHV
jgi:galactofuranose transport system ATP-binding protein